MYKVVFEELQYFILALLHGKKYTIIELKQYFHFAALFQLVPPLPTSQSDSQHNTNSTADASAHAYATKTDVRARMAGETAGTTADIFKITRDTQSKILLLSLKIYYYKVLQSIGTTYVSLIMVW